MDFLNQAFLLGLVAAFFTSWQVKTLLGLILIDVLLGIAAAVKRDVFDWGELGRFYQSNVLPYVIGYLAFFVAIGYLIPPESLGELGAPINEGVVTVAWGALVATLLKSIARNFSVMYQGE